MKLNISPSRRLATLDSPSVLAVCETTQLELAGLPGSAELATLILAIYAEDGTLIATCEDFRVDGEGGAIVGTLDTGTAEAIAQFVDQKPDARIRVELALGDAATLYALCGGVEMTNNPLRTAPTATVPVHYLTRERFAQLSELDEASTGAQWRAALNDVISTLRGS